MNNRKLSTANGWIPKLEWLEEWGYLTAGLSFLLVGMISFGYGWYYFFTSFSSGVLHAALVLTNDLLFVVILLELFRTVINFLKSHVISLEPFLYVGVIAGTRRILTGGAQLAAHETLSDQAFNRYLWDIGLNVVIVVGLIFAIFLYNRMGRAREGV